jgi:hypothetical protein
MTRPVGAPVAAALLLVLAASWPGCATPGAREAEARGEYDRVRRRAAALPEPADRIDALQRWIVRQEGRPPGEASPFLPEAREQLRLWRGEARAERLSGYAAAVAAARRRLDADDPAAAIPLLEKARPEADDPALVDELLERARNELAFQARRRAFEALAARAHVAPSREDGIAILRDYLAADPAPDPRLAERARAEIGRLRAELKTELQAEYGRALTAAHAARKARHWPRGLEACRRAREALEQARRGDLRISDDEGRELRDLELVLAGEQRKARLFTEWHGARKAAEAHLGPDRDEAAFDRAIAGLEAFLKGAPHSPHAEEARLLVARLRRERQTWVAAEIERLRGVADADLRKIEALARRARREDDVQADPALAAAVRTSLARLGRLGVAEKDTKPLAARLDAALEHFAPVLIVTAASTRTGDDVPARILLDGAPLPRTTPARVRLEKGRRYSLEIRYPDHAPFKTTLQARASGTTAVNARLRFTGQTVLFREDFDTNRHNWPILDKPEARLDIHEGRYIVEHRRAAGAWLTWRPVPIDAADDFIIETLVRHRGGVRGHPYGLVWGLKDTANFQYFEISGRGSWLAGELKEGKWRNWRDWTIARAIHPVEPNRLSVLRVREDLFLLANGTVMARVPFMRLGGANLGFRVQGAQTMGADWLSVRRLATVFADRFADNRAEWPVPEADGGAVTIGEGRYRVRRDRPGAWVTWRKLPFDPAGDFLIRCDLRRTAGQGGGPFGVLWDADGPERYSFFALDAAGAARAGRREPDHPETWLAPTRLEAVQPGAVSRLTLLKIAGRLNLLAGAEVVKTVPFPVDARPTFGFLVEGPQSVEILRLEVHTAPPE